MLLVLAKRALSPEEEKNDQGFSKQLAPGATASSSASLWGPRTARTPVLSASRNREAGRAGCDGEERAYIGKAISTPHAPIRCTHRRSQK